MDLKQLRISKGLTQTEASKLVNVPLRTYKRIENSGSTDSFKYQNIYEIIHSYKKKKKKIHNDVNYKITIAGIGYVGLSLGVLLSQNNCVTMVDLISEKVDKINQHISPFKDPLIEDYIANKKLTISATMSNSAYQDADIIIIATPTDFDEGSGQFNTHSVEEVIFLVNAINSHALVVIKSTVPIGFTNLMTEKYPHLNIIFSPEFLREGHALYDNLYPSRIIIGANTNNKMAKQFAHLLEQAALNLNKAIYMSPKEAEATKLFSNAYLAMRVAYFNELDSYALSHNLNSENIIKGMSYDPRIGDYYNNPSFGYGGYCLPKDSAQLSSSFVGIANSNLIRALLISNQTRKEFIADKIIEFAFEKTKKNIEDITIGIYKLSMKAGSDNYRSSSSLDVYYLLLEKNIKVIIYDKMYNNSIADFTTFINQSDVIITNRMYKELSPYKVKVFTRDIYKRD